MAIDAPDPRTFQSWEDAFKYPVPVVRKFEQQLRSNASENREKLRSLVGASYRDLLGTAERIIEMDHQIQDVDATLGVIGRKCNSRRVDKIAKNYSDLLEHTRKLDGERYSFTAQLRVLQSCPTVMRRLLKRGSIFLAAKVLVVSRLLHNDLSKAPDAPPFLESLKLQLGSLRRKLLNNVDKHFSRPSADISDVLESMVAFSLATSSTPSDVLRHFHHVRLESITRLVEEGRANQEHLPKALKLYVRTLQDSQTIFPNRLSEALVKLKARPLLQDNDIKAIVELDLDVHQRWIADNVRNYTPWPRHDELSTEDSERLLKAWSKQAIKSFLDTVRKVLEDLKDPKTVRNVRRDVLETWLSSNHRYLGVKPASILDDLRDAFTDRLRTLFGNRAAQLQKVTAELKESIDDWDEVQSDQVTSLWDPSTTSIDISHGAPAFKQAIIERSHGINASLRRLISTYAAWSQSLEEVFVVIKEMKDTRWDDDLNVDDDDDDFDLDSRQALLSEDDPRTLEDSLNEALSESLAKLQKDVEGLAQAALTSSDHDAPLKAMLILRSLREISQRLASLSDSTRRNITSPTTFPVAITQPLHLSVAKAVAATPLATYKISLNKFASTRKARARALWEGMPQLPVQPSVPAFKFMSALSKEMTSRGGDLWSPGAVSVLKKEIASAVGDLLDETVSVIESATPPTQDDEAKEEDSHATKDENKDNDDSSKGENKADEGTAEANGEQGHEESKDDEEESSETAPDTTKPTLSPTSAPPETNGTSTSKAPVVDAAAFAAVKKDKLTHLLFDVMYLSRALSRSTGTATTAEESTLATLEKRIQDALPGLDKAAEERLRKGTVEYWRRTYLMFALLV
ncbi:uncharacterized protein J3D65DRAFT_623275 [Phyllosticta citribraziliensis]|uniref:Conserved oligomeric Golgi complex subunit 1 n=1 Tax=Phyllosticta citribraziliensis TaxID=989973 RepID=A0ABR1LYJ7_9PEZI